MKNKGETLASILNDFKGCYFFLHNTREINVVKIIMNEGFIFENQLPHSTDRINPNEPIEITYFLFQRKEYGSYTIIIAIPKTTYDFYKAISNKKEVTIEEVFTIKKPYIGDNEELLYTLSPKHVLGYFDLKTSEFHQNQNWDPLFNFCRAGNVRKKSGKPGKR